MRFSRPRGTRDFLPDEMAKRRFVEGVMRDTFEKYGYREIKTPTFESLKLITTKSGEDIRKHLYHFKDKSNRSLALRPELTAPAMRLYVEEMQFKPKPVKLYYFDNCFRYERPQSWRYREFWQAGIELIGTSYPEAEAEAIALAVETLHRLKLADFELHVGSVGILRKMLDASGVSGRNQAMLINAIDKGEGYESLLKKLKISEKNRKAFSEVLTLAGDKANVIPGARELVKGSEPALRELERLEELLKALEHFNIVKYKVNLGIVRGLDYYAGMVFEIYSNKLGAQKQICGGGTYSLVKTFGGEDVATCGFAFGFDRVLLAMEAEKLEIGGKNKTNFLVVPTGENLLENAIKIASTLRKRSSCEVELMRRKLGKALAYANSTGVKFAVIVGDEELSRNAVVVRNMETGEQKEVKIEELDKFSAGIQP